MATSIAQRIDRLEDAVRDTNGKIKAITKINSNHTMALNALDGEKAISTLHEFLADLSHVHARLKTTISQLTVITEIAHFLKDVSPIERANTLLKVIAHLDDADPDFWDRAANTMTLGELIAFFRSP